MLLGADYSVILAGARADRVASLPLDANAQSLTILATHMPFIDRG